MKNERTKVRILGVLKIAACIFGVFAFENINATVVAAALCLAFLWEVVTGIRFNDIGTWSAALNGKQKGAVMVAILFVPVTIVILCLLLG